MILSIGEILVDIFVNGDKKTVYPGGAPFNLACNIKKFNGEKMILLFGDKDPSFHFVKQFSELSNGKVIFEIISGADHYFTNKLELFMSLPKKYFFTLSNQERV